MLLTVLFFVSCADKVYMNVQKKFENGGKYYLVGKVKLTLNQAATGSAKTIKVNKGKYNKSTIGSNIKCNYKKLK